MSMVNWKTKLVNWGFPLAPALMLQNMVSILNTKNAVRLKTRTTRVEVVLFSERTSFHVFKIISFYAAIFYAALEHLQESKLVGW